MSRRRHLTLIVLVFIGVALPGLLNGSNLAWAQTFSSGSTGALGALNPTSNTTVTLPPDGVLNYTTVNVPAGVTVTFVKNAANTPVTLLATGDVTIAGTMSVNGGTGPNSGPVPGQGGPGGFPGGIGGSPPVGGSGPGGGGSGGPSDNNATYGVSSAFVSLLPLFGGSGGGGGPVAEFGIPTGGGGGGAIVVASSTKITVTGSVTATGGNGGAITQGTAFQGGGGSGGAIRLVAPQVTGSGTLLAQGGFQGGNAFNTNVRAGDGRIRMESFTVSALPASTPAASLSTALGPVTAASTPALINPPTLTISSVSGIAGPTTPTGSYTTADIALPAGTTNPVSVTLTGTNIPVGTVFTIRIIPQLTAVTTLSSAPSTGTFANSTATASVNLPTGQVSLLLAFANITLPQLASLVPMFDGEPIERVMVAAEYGGPSRLTLITPSGKEVRPDQLPLTDQLKLAMAFESLSKEASR